MKRESTTTAVMGNKQSLKVDYEALNQSCEQIVRDQNSQIQWEQQEGLAMQRHPKVLRHISAVDPSHPDYIPEATQMRSARSLPNVNEEPTLLESTPVDQSSPLERRMTISQPIRIPGKGSLLTVENVTRNTLKDNAVPPTTTALDLGGPYRPNVELVKCDDIVIHFDSMLSPEPGSSSAATTTSPYSVAMPSAVGNKNLLVDHLSFSRRIGSAPPDFMADFNPRQGQKIPARNRHFSAGFDELPPPSTGFGFFPQPKRGQSLISYLQTVHFSSSNSELERENAHFSVCEAVICAIEQLKWNKQQRRLRKSRLTEVQAMDGDVFDRQISSDEEEERDKSNRSFDSDLVSETASYVSGAVAGAVEWAETTRETTSSEGIGLSLLAKFSGDRSLPNALDINWSIGSGSFNSRFSYGDNTGEGSFCRGTKDWAPPRGQIIFTRKRLPTSRKKILQDQKYRCRGCGSHVTKNFCNYTGQYYCTVCHRKQMAVIPARVLDDWNFSLYPFSYRFLEDIFYSPLYQISSINADLYDRIAMLRSARQQRESLRLVKDHILACRFFAQEEKSIFQNVPDYYSLNTGLWSLADLIAVQRGGFKLFLRHLLQKCEDHVMQCELCKARGYICELCHNDDVIFPWQTHIVDRCPVCGACFHKGCWSATDDCLKCVRIRQRK